MQSAACRHASGRQSKGGGRLSRASPISNARFVNPFEMDPFDANHLVTAGRQIVETIHGIWHGGFAAVPANAKLHGRELGYILEHSGARACFVSEDMETEVARHAPK